LNQQAKNKFMDVKAWEQQIKIPTYKTGEPDKNPMFLEKRVYQGSSGVVYPHAVIDKVYDHKEEKEYTALFLENDYLKVMILPELGGRIQMAYDKTNDYHFIYHNSVIKPALVGLAGPWISGGIEFNWPQHHRPSTFNATDYTIEEHEDGSKTVWVNEYEIMFRTKCALGFTLHPGKAYIALQAKLYNRTPFPQTFLWWANPAVSVDEHYQSVFPPDVHAVYDHGKRDVSSFPIATGTYYKVDYSPGTDISRYTNIPVPTSYMAVNSEFDFVGGYHHQKKAGMVHIASHHVSPGKKQWTWGCGEFGKAWDRQLTDNDGPYFELMCGVFTDNQPDFSWIMPNEVRTFEQFFMPYKNAGYIKNASVDAVVNLEITGSSAGIWVYVSQQRVVTVLLQQQNDTLLSETVMLSPFITYEKNIELPLPAAAPEYYYLQILDEQGRILIDYRPVVRKDEAMPDPATPIPAPGDIKTTEELYLAGLHLEQYRHATRAAEDYYSEAIRRAPSDIRNNNALGLIYLRRGEYKKSETYFRTAVEKMNRHNPNPYDSEPLYNLGLCLQFQKRYAEAEKAFHKCTWNTAMQDAAFLQLAYLACIQKNWAAALRLAEQSLARNAGSLKAKHLKLFILRKLKKYDTAAALAGQSLQADAFDFGSRYELSLILTTCGKTAKAAVVLAELKKLMRNNSNSYIEIAIDYASAGDYETAFDFIFPAAAGTTSPMIFYYMGFYAGAGGDAGAAAQWYLKGFECEPHGVFPNRLEDIEVLKDVIAAGKQDYKACYYLGNYYYAKRRYADAKRCWEQSVALCGTFATAQRNLGIACFNKFDLKEMALEYFEKAFACDPSDSRVLFELDQLYKRLNRPMEERLRLLDGCRSLVEERDDLYIEYISLLSATRQFEKAQLLLAARNFHPWEGGEGKTSGQHVYIHVELAKTAFRSNNLEEALLLLKSASQYPNNLGEGKLHGAQENDIYYWMGCVHESLNEKALARECWLRAAAGPDEPVPAVFYNDQQPDKIFYQGLALLKLGRDAEANSRFARLIRFGEDNMNKEVKIDFFAVSLPDLSIFDDDLNLRNNIHCHYLSGLGFLGLGEYDAADGHFKQALALDPAHAGAIAHRPMVKKINEGKVTSGMTVTSQAG
jgi:tetratricopeptide (TPR) repeat protein